MTPRFFKTESEFRKWLEKNHKKEAELLVGFYKVKTGMPSMTWSQSVDQALCFGWIDGIRKNIDTESYSIRFTPRRSTSIWSTINIKKVGVLTKAGLMKEAGLKAFSLKRESRSKIYSHEKATSDLDPVYQKQFKKNKVAWDFFVKQAPSYKKVVIHWILNAKREETRQTRLERVIKESEQLKRLK